MPHFDPVPMDPFSRYAADMFDEREVISVPTGFQAFFGNPASGAYTHYSPDANAVDIDIIRGNKKTAALIPRGIVARPLGSNQKNLNDGKWTAFARKYPLAEEEGDISGDELLYRMPGENAYGSRTRLDRMRAKARSLHMESVRRIVRLNEILASLSILTGAQPAILGTTNPDMQYDFRRNPAHMVSVSTAWNSGGDPLADVDGVCDKIEANGNASPDFMGLGGEVMDAFIRNTTVQAVADNRRFELIEVSTKNPVPPRYDRFVSAGWVARGRLRTPKGYNLWMFTYERTYTSNAGVPTKLMPEDQAFVCSSGARCDRYFGPPENLPMLPQRVQLYQEMFGFNPNLPPMPVNIQDPGNIVLPSMFYCDAYVSPDWKRVTIRTQSAPIFATTQTDAFATLTDLVDS